MPDNDNNSHMDPKVLGYLQNISGVTPHREHSGNARALEKSGEIGKMNVAMYISIRMALWTLTTLRGNPWALLNASLSGARRRRASYQS